MKQESAYKFIGGQCHRFFFGAIFVITPLERNLPVLYAEYAMVGNGDAVGIPAEVLEDGVARFEWALAVNIPILCI